ncbi:MAG: DUF5060 domain-containing protein, partial [Anaerolineae bacterium]|nr:DUF5060 domain-containing protein [Anaerolineae bacterium]
SFANDRPYENRFFDVTLEANLTAPGGAQHRVKGFYYGGNLWKVRFRPDEPGNWTYTYIMTGKDGFNDSGVGEFACTPGEAPGLVRRNPENPYRWVIVSPQTGQPVRPYFPVGLQDCFGLEGAQFSDLTIDGEKRDDPGRLVSLDEYFAIYGQAGFNLFRYSQRNCSRPLFDDLDHYREAEGIATDELLSVARKHGFRVMFGFFGYYDEHTPTRRAGNLLERIIQAILGARAEPADLLKEQEVIAKEKRFIDYSLARWGVYVDFWQLLNESEAPDEWITTMADYVRSVDPYQRPVTTSWERPTLPAIEINAPHWYESERESDSDLRVRQLALKWKRAGKPVIVGEQGNSGMNWDPTSGPRMRIRTWAALFQEITFIFWNTSWSKYGMFQGRYTPGGAANIYLGPEERGYIRVLQNFSARLDADVRMAPVGVSLPRSVRAYGLRSDTVAAVYLHHFRDHSNAVRGLTITLDVPGGDRSKPLTGEWLDPSTGNVLGRVSLSAGHQTLAVPSFSIDLALLVTS